jgi:hypothetical protein
MRSLRVACVVCIAASSIACSEKERPAGAAATPDTGVLIVADTHDPADTTAAADSGTPSADTAVDSSSPTDSATPEDADGDTSAPIDAGGIDSELPDAAVSMLCPSTYSEVPGTPVPYAKSSNDLLAGMTWDELTIAWATTSGGKVTIQYADRTSRDDPFGAPKTLPDTLGPLDTKVAFTADGRTMLFVSADHLSLRQITRASRAEAFVPSTATSAPFAKLIGTSGEGGSTPKKVGDIVLSRDGQMLWYTDMNRTSGSSIRVSFRLTDGTFDAPNAVTTARLQMIGSDRRRPTGISADGRVLFFWDESTELAHAGFRAGSSIEFTSFSALAPNGMRAMPNDGCDRFYASLFVAGDKDGGGDTTQIVRVP